MFHLFGCSRIVVIVSKGSEMGGEGIIHFLSTRETKKKDKWGSQSYFKVLL